MKPKPINAEDQELVRFGRAALIPGIQKSIEALQDLIRNIQLQNAASEGMAIPTDGRRKSNTWAKNYWASMTPEERSAEMKRRVQKAKNRRKSTVNHPRNPAHPGHKAWVAKIQRAKSAARIQRARGEAA